MLMRCVIMSRCTGRNGCPKGRATSAARQLRTSASRRNGLSVNAFGTNPACVSPWKIEDIKQLPSPRAWPKLLPCPSAANERPVPLSLFVVYEPVHKDVYKPIIQQNKTKSVLFTELITSLFTKYVQKGASTRLFTNVLTNQL